MTRRLQVCLTLALCLSALLVVWNLRLRRGPTPPSPTALGPCDTGLLFIGNSFSSCNDLHAMTAALMQEPTPGRRIVARLVARGGATMADHAAGIDLEPCRTYLSRTTGPMWSAIVLQGQSQVPAFSPNNRPTAASIGGFVRFARRAAAFPGRIILLMTWGANGPDPFYPEQFPSFGVMQARLAAGYLYIRNVMSRENPRVTVAPVGLAFERIGRCHPDLFPSLYAADGKHPSPAGSYLAAAVLAACCSDRPVVSARWCPPGLSPSVAATLRRCAGETVQAYRPPAPPKGFVLTTAPPDRFGFEAAEAVMIEMTRGSEVSLSTISDERATFELIGGRLMDHRFRDWGLNLTSSGEPRTHRSGDEVFLLRDGDIPCRLRFVPARAMVVPTNGANGS